MSRLRIAELHIELRRRGGWSWGPDPRGLAESLQRALPAVVARELRRLLPRELAGRVSAPLRVDLKISAAELGELLVAAERTVPGAGVPGTTRAPTLARGGMLAERLGPRVRAALARGIAALPPASFTVTAVGAEDQAAPADDPDELVTRWAGSLLRMLTAWRRQGDLPRLLASVEAAALQRWHSILLIECPARATDRTLDVASAVAASCRVLEPIEHADPQARRAAERLLLVVMLHEQLGLRPDDPIVRAELDRALPPARASELEHERSAAALERPASGLDRSRERPATRPPARAHTHRASASVRLQTGDERLGCALPFLALASLARLGWVELLDALLIERRALADAPALASALAFKLLPTPRRGWLRTPADELSAAAFAGEREPIAEARRARVTDLLADTLAPLDLLLTRVLARGRTDHDPLLLLRAPIDADDDPRGWLALELEGGFVLARALELDALLDNPALAHAPLLVPASEADPLVTQLLVARGREFLTDALPGRGDDWRALRRGRLRLWTTSTATEPGPFAQLSRLLPLFETDERERLRRAWTEVVARPGVLRGPRLELERSLGFAVHLALSDLAWNLWRTREPTDAALPYERFSDLDLQLRVERDRVRLLLPRGARRDHLAAAGMLTDLDAVPWWPDRRFEWGVG